MSDTSPNLKITLVPRDKVRAVWPRIVTLLEPALETVGGRFGSDDILGGILQQKMQLWIVYRDRGSGIEREDIVASFTTKVYNVPRAKVCVAEWAGGEDMERWIDDAIEILEKFARDCGCQRIETHGRRGWKKYVERHGWKFFSISYEKEL